jgi:hypothetical protein
MLWPQYVAVNFIHTYKQLNYFGNKPFCVCLLYGACVALDLFELRLCISVEDTVVPLGVKKVYVGGGVILPVILDVCTT